MALQATSSALDAAAFDCVAQLDEAHTALIVVNVHAMSRVVTARDFDYINRAGAYVWTAAALEAFLKRYIQSLVLAINAAAVPRKNLRTSLLALDNAPSFQAMHSLAHPRDLKKWSHQVAVLESVESPEVARLSAQEEHWPTDGSTLKREHLEVIWRVFGLRPPEVPSERTYGFLKDLRENRTRAAHGEASAVALGRQKSSDDVLRMVRQAEELVIYLYDRASTYLAVRDFLR